MIEELLRQWDGTAVVTAHDAVTGAWIFIALHDNTLGPPTGGTRLKIYDHPADGLRDAMRLAEGMTFKWAGIDIPKGGGKGVIALTEPVSYGDRERLLQRYGRLVESLHGGFMTGQDLGTTPEDMLTIASETQYVHGIDYNKREALDPGPYTAHGVHVGICAAVEHVTGSDSLEGVTVLIQGAGDVGVPLGRALAQAGASLLVADVDTERAQGLAGETGGTVVETTAVYGTRCDVYAPCAVGATVNAETIPNLACRIVAGSANNQLAEPEDAGRLLERGILYAPDYIINGGGATAFGLMAQGTDGEAELFRQVERIGPRLRAIFREAAEREESPVWTAERMVQRALGRA